MKLIGKKVSRGIVIGKVLKYKPFKPEIKRYNIRPNEIEAALASYARAVSQAKAELLLLKDKLMHVDALKAEFATSQLGLVDEPSISLKANNLIKNELISPERAIQMAYDQFADVIKRAKKEPFYSRISGINEAKDRVLRCYFGVEEHNISSLNAPSIIVAYELRASDLVSLDRKHVVGIITEAGGISSHTAITARSYEIPAILGVNNAMRELTDGEIVVLNAESGEVIIEPEEDEIFAYSNQGKMVLKELAEQKTYIDKEPITKDGHKIAVSLNIVSGNDEELSKVPYSDGCGLFRTEFLFLGKEELPDEEQQLAIYKRVLAGFAGKPVVLRTMDIGGDKHVPQISMPKEDNPFLGLRGIRLSLVNEGLFRTQIRAALRASAFGRIDIMLPMVSSINEIRVAKEIIKQVGQELDYKKLKWDRETKIGIMVEVPAIALIADLVAEEVDFASIGTNDLCQYLNAADRMNNNVSAYYQDYHPSVFRLIKTVTADFQKAGKPVSICGELGGDPLAIPALIGLGVDSLSMNASSMARAKKTIINSDSVYCQALAKKVLKAKTNIDVSNLLHGFADK